MFIRGCGGRKKSEKFVATEGTISVTANVSGASVQVTSGTAIVFSQQMNGNSLTTSSLPNGEYTLKVTKDGYDDVIKQVTVKGDIVENITMIEKTGANAYVVNSLKDYKDTVLVNDNAIVTVTMRDKSGNPVANKIAVLTLGDATNSTYGSKIKVKGQTVATTDANGNATFVVGYEDIPNLKATSTSYVSSIKYTASVVGEDATATGSISFAAIKIGSVSAVNKNLKAGTSASDAGYTDGIEETKNLSGENAEYISTQQVSSKDVDHSVEFNVTPKISLPAIAEDDKNDKYVQSVNYSSEKYHTYANNEKVVNLDVDTSGLKYASMNFDKIQLSPYTEMDIEFYSEKDATGSETGNCEKIKADDLYGMDKKNRTVQIPLTGTSVKSVKIILKSAGQVQTDMNDGYTLKDITYVYGEVTGKGSTDVPLSSASIKWEAVNPNFSQPKELDIESTAGKGLGITKEYDDDTFSYEVPAFPLTGNAVITEKDKNGKIVAYYLVPTENQTGDKANTNDIKKIENKNEYVKAYKATAEEVSNYITTGVTQSDNGRTVKVDSEKNGITTLKGVLSIDGLGSDLLDATNREIYTSVQWNPIPNKAEESKSDAFLAIAGQKITVTGQLVDKNGNSVSTSGKTIKFYKDGKEIMSDEKVTVVKAPAATDTNGKSTIVLSAAQATAFPNVTASCTDSQYDVKLTIKDSSVSDKADLYWVNAAPTNGKFVKLEVTFYDNTDVSKGKAIATKYLKLTSDGSKYILSK